MSHHVLIVTYSFFPANTMAAHRIYLRAKGLDELGVRVTIVTRAWREGQSGLDPQDVSPEEVSEEPLFSRAKIIRVPFGPAGWEGNVHRALGLVSKWPLLHRVAQNICHFLLPLESHFRLRPELPALAARLRSPPNFVLASGDPWSNFSLGKRIARHFGAKYVAEYRDPWNYNDEKFRVEGFNSYNDNFVSRAKQRLAMWRERRLNRDADLIIAASQPFLENAIEVTQARDGMVVTNGFDPAEIEAIPRTSPKALTFTYTGTIYSQQQSEVFFEALNQFMWEEGVPRERVKVILIGSKLSHGFEKTMESIRRLDGHEQIVQLLGRVEKRLCLEIQRASSVLLYFAHKKSVGIFPGKIFEYLGMGVPILLVPSDQGVSEQLLRETGTGTFCHGVEETKRFIKEAYRSHEAEGRVGYHPNQEAVMRYSYKNIARNLYERLVAL